MAAKIDKYNPDTMAAPLGRYHHVARSKAAEHLHIAGQVGVDRDGNVVGDAFEAQMRQTFANLHAALRSAGAEFSNVVKFTTYLVRAEDIDEFKRVRDDVYAEHFPNGDYPPNTLLVISGLVNPALLLEIEAVAAV